MSHGRWGLLPARAFLRDLLLRPRALRARFRAASGRAKPRGYAHERPRALLGAGAEGRALLLTCALWTLILPLIGVALVGGALTLSGLPFSWARLGACGMAALTGGAFVSLLWSVVGGLYFAGAGGIALGFAGGIAWGQLVGPRGSLFFGLSLALAFGYTMGRAYSWHRLRIAQRPQMPFLWPMAAMGLAIAASSTFVLSGPPSALNAGFALVCLLALGIVVGSSQLLSWIPEALWTLGLRLGVALRPTTATRLARLLPIHLDKGILQPLPGLTGIIKAVGAMDPEAALTLVETAKEAGQEKAAERALTQLQVQSLARAARDRSYARAAAMELPWMPLDQTLPPDSPVRAIMSAARDLQAGRISQSHHHREKVLGQAARSLQSIGYGETTRLRRAPLDAALGPAVAAWEEAVRDEEAALQAERASRPQVPLPWVVGPAIGPDDRGLFVGRGDLVALIDHDLTGQSRAPILLVGQRRMGKSSLLNMLPYQLGSAVSVLPLNFQALGGSPHRDAPHNLVIEALAAHASEHGAELPALPSPDAPWGAALDWMAALDARLNAEGRRILIAIDEIERLEGGIREGWGSPEFLSFLRAAGDGLRSLQILMVSGLSLERLGPHWSDRLVSARVREIGPLAPEAALGLITRPIPGFPDIYPPGGAALIAEETAGHPYLIQLVCDELCRRLNTRGALVATAEDLDAALDGACASTPLFRELWNQRSQKEQALLRALALGEPLPESSAPLKALARDGHLVGGPGGWRLTFPLFKSWIQAEA